MLIFVDDQNQIIGNQQNPNNGLTSHWAEDDENWGGFHPEDYEKCELIKES